MSWMGFYWRCNTRWLSLPQGVTYLMFHCTVSVCVLHSKVHLFQWFCLIPHHYLIGSVLYLKYRGRITLTLACI